MKTIVINALLAIILSLSQDNQKPVDYVRYADEITHDFIKQVQSEYGFSCYSTGGRMPYDVEEISVGFCIYERGTIERARELEIKLTEQLRRLMNTHEKIRPFLREYPVSSSRARVTLAFTTKDGQRYHDGSVCMVCRRMTGEIVYDTAYLKVCPARPTVDGKTGKIIHPGTERITDGFEILLEESYEDAVKILKAQNKL